MSVSYGGDSITFADGSVQSGGWTGMRNRIINGAMVIAQRATSATPTAGGYFTIDRWRFSQAGSYATSLTPTISQSSTAPAGFINSFLYTNGTGAAPTAAQLISFDQYIEGLNCADLDFGSATAATVTVSFWVRASVTGTYSVALTNDGLNRSYVSTYTINSANTWEQKSVTIAGDTSGTWLKTNGTGIRVSFSIGAGSNLQTTAGAWQAGNFYTTSACTNLTATTGATFHITGVQLERGSTASSFEYRSYGTDLALCQRYYFRKNIPLTNDYFTILQAYNTSSAYGKLFDLPVTMRATPTGSLSAIGSFRAANAAGSGSAPFTAGSVDSVSTTSIGTGSWTGASGIVAGNAVVIACGAVAWIAADAEL